SGLCIDADNEETNVISLNGLIVDGQLQFSVATKLGETDTQVLAMRFEKWLKEVVAHCQKVVTAKQIEYTLSDLQPFKFVECMNESITGHPLWIFPPGGYGAEAYYGNICKFLTDKKLFLFNNFLMRLREIDDKAASRETYERLAQIHIEEMKKYQPEGPYNLLGSSFGGVLATEVARQLEKMGEAIENVFLIDAYFNYKYVANKISPNNNWFEGDINYGYCPNVLSNFFGVITLFKALREDNDIDNEGSIACAFNRYYLENTVDNYLGKFFPKKNIRVINMQASHISWARDEEVIHLICDSCKKYLKDNVIE
ncbi:MAG: thioesterase domain-containing protein, partial [Pseudomonadota bacterium]